LYENSQEETCKALPGLSIHAKMVRGGRPLLCENLAKTDPPLKNADFQQYLLVAPQL